MDVALVEVGPRRTARRDPCLGRRRGRRDERGPRPHGPPRADDPAHRPREGGDHRARRPGRDRRDRRRARDRPAAGPPARRPAHGGGARPRSSRSVRDGLVVELPGLGPTTVGLRGRHQAENAAVADATLDALAAAGIATPSPRNARGRVRGARWPGRLELLTVDGRDVLLDGAHNPAGAAALAQALDDLRPFLTGGDAPAATGRRSPSLTASMADKDVAGVVRALARRRRSGTRVSSAPAWTCPGRCRPTSWRRPGRSSRGDRVVSAEPDVAAALDQALDGRARPDRRGRFALPRRCRPRPPRRRPAAARPGGPFRPMTRSAQARPMSRSDPTERALPAERGVVPPARSSAAEPRRRRSRPTGRRSASTAAWAPAPRGAPRPAPTTIGGRLFAWGSRTFVMGIVNVTPDSFSGDGLLGAPDRPRRQGAGPRRRRRRRPGARPADGGRGRRPARRRRRIEPAGPRRRGRGRGGAAGRAGRRRDPSRPCRTCRSASTRRSRRSPRPRSTPGRRSSTTSGASLPTARCAGSPRTAACRSCSCTTGPRPATTDLVGEVLADLRSGDRARPRGRRPGGLDRRRPGLRLRQGTRPQPRAARRARPAAGRWAGRSSSARRASRPSARSSTCPPTSAWRRPSPRPRWPSGPGSTSCASTTSGPTSGRRGSPMPSSRLGRAPRDRPDRAPRHAVPRSPRRR